jgi:hypothetical protein
VLHLSDNVSLLSLAVKGKMWKQFFIRLRAKGRRLNARWQEHRARQRWLMREKRRCKAEEVSVYFSLM